MDIDENAMSVQDVAKYLRKSEKTIYRWLDTGKLHSEQIRGLHFIARAEVEALAGPGLATTDQTQRLDIVEKRLDTRDTLLDAYGARIADLERRVGELFQKLQEWEQEAVQPLHRFKVDADDTREEPHQGRAQYVKSTVPEGYVLVRHFNEIHGMKDTSIGRRAKEGIIHITYGEWQVGRTRVTQILSPTQQHRYWLALHLYPDFTPCPHCPHEEGE